MSKKRTGSKPLYSAKHGGRYCAERKLCCECGGKLTGRRQSWCSQDCVDAYLIRASPTDARRHVFDRDRGVCAGCGLDTDEVREHIKAADKIAFAAYLKEWNQKNPWGVEGDYSKPHRWAHQGYARYRGPKRYVGFSTGSRWPQGTGSPRRKRHREIRVRDRDPGGRLWELVREHRLACLGRLGLDRLGKWWYRKTLWDCNHIRPVELGGGECGLGGLETLCCACHEQETVRQNSELASWRARKKRGASRRRPGMIYRKSER